MAFLYEKKKSKKDGHEYIEITGYEGNGEKLVIPKTIEGLSVEAIGNHSFSGREDIVSVEIPESVKTLYGFAFHNCKNLEKISIFDSLDDYYDGVCRQCDKLKIIDITVNSGWYEVIRNFLADSDRTLEFRIHIKTDNGYDEARLTFPEFVYDFNENTMARTIQFSIAGSGYAYRECVDRRSIDYREYDRLFDKAVIDGNALSESIAMGRLLFPKELLEGYRAVYEKYVRKNGAGILCRLIDDVNEDENLELMKALLTYRCADAQKVLEDADIDKAIKYASDKGKTLFSAVFMDAGAGTAGTATEFVL
ncbi:leucine-rich repeat domain-containing protein [Butyrivibrio sp. X503]|uniref:leucine-rich repeat protein n=1 Tax=Butyrivibrio sp. X503 TaxID=2364878 RepID=UPI000EA90C58|nr:leucine-rich repeat domain-containing protein [Butyrivibrio sp. X503]RKM58189.1 leucine-rich repeat domain-containing protein [Butyrivibrio sp. X503]